MKSTFRQMGAAFRTLSPDEVRRMASRHVAFGILTEDDELDVAVRDWLDPSQPGGLADWKIVRVSGPEDFSKTDVGFAEPGIPHPRNYYPFDPSEPEAWAGALLDDHEDLWLPLAASFGGFRRLVSERLIRKISKENALVAMSTSLPNVIPSILSIPWAVGEFASDTAILTANQVRLSFFLAAAHNMVPGYDKQTVKIGSIVGSAFGWRALARQAVSKMPAGGGLVSKGLIALGGTYVVGRALEHWYCTGTPLGRAAKREFYAEAVSKGRSTVERMVRVLKPGPRPVEGIA